MESEYFLWSILSFLLNSVSVIEQFVEKIIELFPDVLCSPIIMSYVLTKKHLLDRYHKQLGDFLVKYLKECKESIEYISKIQLSMETSWSFCI